MGHAVRNSVAGVALMSSLAFAGLGAAAGAIPKAASDVAPRASAVSAAAKPVFAVTASTAPGAVLVGAPITISGVVTPRAKGVTVVSQRFFAKKWRAVAVTTTTAGGKYISTFASPRAVTRPAIYRAYVEGNRRRGSGSSSKVDVPVVASAFAVTASVSAGITETDTTFVIFGAVRPAVATPVELQTARNGVWVNAEAGRTSADGAFALRATAQSPGNHYYRVVAPATASEAAGISGASRKVIGVWHYLSDLPVDTSDSFNTGSAEIDGTTYSHSIFNEQDYWAPSDQFVYDFNLARQCYTLSAVAGLTDDSDAGVPYEFDTLVDGNTISTVTAQLGQEVPLNLNIEGDLRLELSWTQTAVDNGPAGVQAALGNAEVFCSF